MLRSLALLCTPLLLMAPAGESLANGSSIEGVGFVDFFDSADGGEAYGVAFDGASGNVFHQTEFDDIYESPPSGAPATLSFASPAAGPDVGLSFLSEDTLLAVDWDTLYFLDKNGDGTPSSTVSLPFRQVMGGAYHPTLGTFFVLTYVAGPGTGVVRQVDLSGNEIGTGFPVGNDFTFSLGGIGVGPTGNLFIVSSTSDSAALREMTTAGAHVADHDLTYSGWTDLDFDLDDQLIYLSASDGTVNVFEYTLVGSSNTPPDCSAAGPDSDEIWPPDHKFADVSVAGVTDADGDEVAISISSIAQDEPVEGLGDGNTCPDGLGVGTSTASVRAERSGTAQTPGDGRVYHIGFTADDGRGGTCSATVTVCVPHDQRPGHVCVDQGALYDSTSCGE